jgi:FMN reductase
MRHTRIVAVNGSLSPQSRTGQLIDAVVQSLTDRLGSSDVHVVDLGTIGIHLAGTLDYTGHPPEIVAALERIRRADILIAASPVYKGGYTGLFKHLFDLVDPEALVGKPVLLAATGGSDRHCLAVDHVFRPLFSFFRAYTVPSAVYATPGDFRDGHLVGEAALARVGEAAAQAAVLVHGPVPAPASRVSVIAKAAAVAG